MTNCNEMHANMIVSQIAQEDGLVNMGKWFWRTIIFLFVLFISLVISAWLNVSDGQLEKAKYEQVLSTETLSKVSPYLAELLRKTANEPLSKEFKQQISWEVDRFFQPVYQHIPQFVDTHYSVVGEYMELGLAASGKLANHIQNQLFPSFHVRAKQMSSRLASDLKNEIEQAAKKQLHANMQAFQIPKDQQEAFEKLLAIYLKNEIRDKIFARGTIAIGAGILGGAVGGAAAIKLIAATLAKKMLFKLGAKITAKGVAKTAGAGASAAAGATIGSVVPGVGTVIGGIVGGVIGWFATDAAVVSVDEWLNRDEFENSLNRMITEQKEKMKQDIILRISNWKKQALLKSANHIKNKAPASL